MAVIESTAGVRKGVRPRIWAAVSRVPARLSRTIPFWRGRSRTCDGARSFCPRPSRSSWRRSPDGETSSERRHLGCRAVVPPGAEPMDERAAEEGGSGERGHRPDTARKVELMAASMPPPTRLAVLPDPLAVDPQRQGQGVGSRLLEHVLERRSRCDARRSRGHERRRQEALRAAWLRGPGAVHPARRPPLYPMWRQPSSSSISAMG